MSIDLTPGPSPEERGGNTQIYEWDFAPTPHELRRRILSSVLSAFNVSADELIPRCRKKKIVNAKRAYTYLTRLILQDTYQRIAMELKLTDHTSVLYLYATADDLMLKKYSDFYKIVNELERKYRRK